jgi:hypothetical protein
MNIAIPQSKLADFCRQHHIAELALFGSVLRDDFRPESDIDVLVSFAPEAHYSLLDFVQLQEKLKQILGREVDLVEKAGLRNPFRRRHILDNMKVIYAS